MLRWLAPSPASTLLAVLVSLVFVPSGPAHAQGTGTIQGVVTSVAGSHPLPDVQVTVLGTTLAARTDERGRYRITGIAAGTQQVRSQRLGLTAVTRSVAVKAGDTTTVDFTLADAALSLDALVVTGTAAESRWKEVGNAMPFQTGTNRKGQVYSDLTCVPLPDVETQDNPNLSS